MFNFQESPLAPFLFIIVTKVFSAYLNFACVDSKVWSRRFLIKMILDVESVDVTALYLHVEECNLCKHRF